MDGRKVGGAGGAVGERAGHHAVVDCVCALWGFVGVLLVPEGGFKGECVLFKPVQECRGAEDARVGILRRVDMSVYIYTG